MIRIMPHRSSRPQIPQPRRSIATRRHQITRIRRKYRIPNPFAMLRQGLRQLPSRCIPQSRGLITARRNQMSAIGRYPSMKQIRPEGVCPKFRQRSQRFVTLLCSFRGVAGIPDEHFGVVVGSDEGAGIGGDVDGLDGHASFGGCGRGLGVWYDVVDAFGASQVPYFDASVLIAWVIIVYCRVYCLIRLVCNT